jgi:hypothetical protein
MIAEQQSLIFQWRQHWVNLYRPFGESWCYSMLLDDEVCDFGFHTLAEARESAIDTIERWEDKQYVPEEPNCYDEEEIEE